LTNDLPPLASYAEVPGEDLLQAKYLLAAIRVHNVRRNDAWAPSNGVGQRQLEALIHHLHSMSGSFFGYWQ